MEKELNQLVAKLREAAGANLKSVVLYGSGATGEFHPKYSDLDVLCVFEHLNGDDLKQMSVALKSWLRKGHLAPQVFTVDELRHSSDVFPMELLDIKACRRILFGEDVFQELEIPLTLHRALVERELRVSLIRLRQRYLSSPRSSKDLLQMMAASLSTFTILFRHVLVAMGEEPPPHKREVIDRLAEVLRFDPIPFHALLGVREGKPLEDWADVHYIFLTYLKAIDRVVNEVDRHFEQLSH